MPAVRRHLLSFLVCIIPLLRAPAPAADITAEWIHPGIGDWTDPANWKNGLIPVSTQADQYHVIITNTAIPWQYIQCSLNQPMSVSALTLNNVVLYAYGGNGNAPQQFEVRDQFRWLGGSLSGWQCTYDLRGEALFEGETHKTLDRFCHIRIHDHALWTGGHLTWVPYGQASIETGAVFDLNTGGTFASDSISNRGTIRITAPGKVVQINSVFENNGAVEVQAGDVRFGGRYSGPGSIFVASNSTFSVTQFGQWHQFTRSGSGEILLAGQQEILTDVDFAGKVRVDAEVFGNGALILTNALWEGGQFDGAGALVVPPGGRLAVQKSGVRMGRALENSGEVSLAPGVFVVLLDGHRHENRSNGVITLGPASSFGTGSSPSLSLINRGTIRNEQAGFGNGDVQCTLINHALVRSTKGRIGLLGGGTNFGTFEALRPGSIRAFGMHLPPTSILQGDGTVELIGGSLDGYVSSNLTLSASSLVVPRVEPYDLDRFRIGSSIHFTGYGGVRVHEHFILNGGYRYGFVRSFGSAEIAVGDVEIRDGSALELDGTNAFTGGILRFMDATFTNRGTMNVLGSAEVNLQSGGLLVNEGTWTFNGQVGLMNVSITPQSSHLRAGNLSGETTVENGPFQIDGPFTLEAGRLSAGPETQMVISDLALTNSELRLIRSTISLTSSLAGSNATFVLEDALIAAPEARFSGLLTLSGNGVLQSELVLRALELKAVAGSNHICIDGALTFATNSASLTISPVYTNGTSRFPFLKVRGPVALAGTLQVSTSFIVGPSNFVAGPVTLIESDGIVAGAFSNVENGGILAAPNGIRCRVHYGPESPHGPNRVVITGFGSAFDQWRAERFSTSELANPEISGASADPDGNGFNNVAEFVFGLGSEDRVRLAAPDADGYSAVQIRRRKDVGNLKAHLGLSSDLRSWTDTVIGATGNGLILHRAYDLPDAYEYHYLIPAAPPSLYLRLTVEGSW